MDIPLVEKFGNKVRLRACGFVFRGEEILLVNHRGLYPHDFWTPPGGAVEFGETVTNALKREFWEECRVDIELSKLLFACEFVKPPLHAVELFEVNTSGTPRLGSDPEMGDNQILTEVRFMDSEEIQALPARHLHGIFEKAKTPSAIRLLKGFFTIN